MRTRQIVLQRQGFIVWTAADGPEGLEVYRHHQSRIALVLLDVRMPGWSGPDTLAALREVNPELPACFMSGETGAYAEQQLRERGAAHVFAKPFRLAELGSYLWHLAADDGAGHATVSA